MSGFEYTHHYSHSHPDTDVHFDQTCEYFRNRLAAYLPHDKNAAMLDVGCGSGYVVGALLRSGYTNSIGIDIDRGQVDRATRHGLPVHLVEDTIAWLRGIPDSRSVIFCFDVIEHVAAAEQVKFVSALHDALCSGGSLVCTVPNANSAMASRYRYGDYTHTSSFTEQSLDFLLYHGGFSEISITADENETRPRWPWLLRPSLRWWYLKRAFRLLRRLEFMVELHGRQGRDVPLSLNLLGVAKR